MADVLNIESFLSKAREGVPVIDVRSPAEYEHAHIPGAVSIPLFDNDQRAAVGTIYNKKGRVKAVRKGLDYVGEKLGRFADEALSLKSPELLLYCWRGGMRSASMAWLFETLDMKCHTLEGGYKNYRNYVLEYFRHPLKLIVLGGCTGAGKTDILHELESRGEQVIDLEGLANHKGSAFGMIGEDPQPSNEMFEHKIFDRLCTFDADRRIWIEDESRNVGKNLIPEGLWNQMVSANLIIVDTDYDVRLERIMKVYAPYPVELLAASIKKIERRIGLEKCKKAYDACMEGNISEAARICLAYYDKMYLSQLEDRKKECNIVCEVVSDAYEVGDVSSEVLNIAGEFDRIDK